MNLGDACLECSLSQYDSVHSATDPQSTPVGGGPQGGMKWIDPHEFQPLIEWVRYLRDVHTRSLVFTTHDGHDPLRPVDQRRSRRVAGDGPTSQPDPPRYDPERERQHQRVKRPRPWEA